MANVNDEDRLEKALRGLEGFGMNDLPLSEVTQKLDGQLDAALPILRIIASALIRGEPIRGAEAEALKKQAGPYLYSIRANRALFWLARFGDPEVMKAIEKRYGDFDHQPALVFDGVPSSPEEQPSIPYYDSEFWHAISTGLKPRLIKIFAPKASKFSTEAPLTREFRLPDGKMTLVYAPEYLAANDIAHILAHSPDIPQEIREWAQSLPGNRTRFSGGFEEPHIVGRQIVAFLQQNETALASEDFKGLRIPTVQGQNPENHQPPFISLPPAPPTPVPVSLVHSSNAPYYIIGAATAILAAALAAAAWRKRGESNDRGTD